MRTLSVLSVVAFGTLLVASTAYARQPRALTLEECIEIGLENSKRLHASLMQVHAADAGARAATAARLPSLTFNAAYTRLSDIPPFEVTLPSAAGEPNTITISPIVLDNYATQLRLQQPLFTGFRLESGARLARHNAQAAREDHGRDRADLRL